MPCTATSKSSILIPVFSLPYTVINFFLSASSFWLVPKYTYLCQSFSSVSLLFYDIFNHLYVATYFSFFHFLDRSNISTKTNFEKNPTSIVVISTPYHLCNMFNP